jgi:predicted CoA-binding protein
MSEGAERRTREELRSILMEARIIAVLGAHPEPAKAAHYVPAYLQSQGYRILPVNPLYAGRTLFGTTVASKLDELGEPVDIVDVFRRGPDVAGHVDEILAMKPLPRVVWLQQGIRNEEACRTLRQHGIDVVQDACTLAEHRSLEIGAVGD